MPRPDWPIRSTRTRTIVISIAVQADGKILAGGNFGDIGGQTRNRIARLDPTTGLADSFDPNANKDVNSIAVQADGKILAGGTFTTIGGQPRNRIARLDAMTGLADSLNPNANKDVNSIAVQADGKILAGGIFTSIGGQPRNLFARLSDDTAALQDLAVTQTTITWTRGGSSPQFTRVTFEYSTDNVNYTPGRRPAVGSDWTLTGLNFPTGQNFYIRARGYYGGGYETAQRAPRNQCGMLLFMGRARAQPRHPPPHLHLPPHLPCPYTHADPDTDADTHGCTDTYPNPTPTPTPTPATTPPTQGPPTPTPTHITLASRLSTHVPSPETAGRLMLHHRKSKLTSCQLISATRPW